MPLRRNFNETILARMERDPAFRKELLKEAVECLLSGGLGRRRAVLIKYVESAVDGHDVD